MPSIEKYNNLKAQLIKAIEAYNTNKNNENYKDAQTLLNRYVEVKQETMFVYSKEEDNLIENFITECQSRSATKIQAVARGKIARNQAKQAANISDTAGKESKAAPTENLAAQSDAGIPGNVESVSEDGNSVNSQDEQKEDTPKEKVTSRWNLLRNMFSFAGSGNTAKINPTDDPTDNPAANAERENDPVIARPVMPKRYEFYGAGIKDHKAHGLKLQEITLDTLKGVYQARNLRNKMISDLTGVDIKDELTKRGQAVWSTEAKEQLEDFKAEREVRKALYNVMIDVAEVTKTKEATDDHSDQNDPEVNQIDNNIETKAKIKPEEINGVIYEEIDGVIYKDISGKLGAELKNLDDATKHKFDNIKATMIDADGKILLPVGYLDQNDQVLVNPNIIDGETAAKIKLLDEKVAIYDKSFLALQSKKTRVYNGLTRSTLGSIHNPNNEKGNRTWLTGVAAFIALGSAFMSILTFSEIGGTVLIPALALGSLTPPGMIVLGSVVALIALVALAILVKKVYDYRAEIINGLTSLGKILGGFFLMVGQEALSWTKSFFEGLGHTIANITLAAVSVAKLVGHVVGHAVKAGIYTVVAVLVGVLSILPLLTTYIFQSGTKEERDERKLMKTVFLRMLQKADEARQDIQAMNAILLKILQKGEDAPALTDEEKALFSKQDAPDLTDEEKELFSKVKLTKFDRIISFISKGLTAMYDDLSNAYKKSWNSLCDSIIDLCNYLSDGICKNSEFSKGVLNWITVHVSQDGYKFKEGDIEHDKRFSKQISDNLPEYVKDKLPPVSIKGGIKGSQSVLQANALFTKLDRPGDLTGENESLLDRDAKPSDGLGLTTFSPMGNSDVN